MQALFVLLSMLPLTATIACQPEPARTIEHSADPNAPDDTERRLIQERERVEKLAQASIGATCGVDKDCPLYLRCITSACAVPPAVDGGPSSDAPVITIAADQGEAQFFMEIQVTDDEKSRGLMFRPRMADDWGMLFIYPRELPLSFWMKNTLIPLDMVFIDDEGLVVGVVENAVPQTLTSRSVPGNSRYVLELNAGLAQRFGIGAGNKVNFIRLPPEYMPTGM